MPLTMTRLELAPSQDFPKGSTSHGYEIVAPINKDGRIDASTWSGLQDKCRTVRFWGEAPKEEGLLRHAGTAWRFDKTDNATSKPFFDLDKLTLLPGAYVSIAGDDGIQRTFRVLMMIPWG
jgi:hypothetical protein